MRAGLGVLGLSPAVFWSMTPRELAAALEGRLGGAPVIATPARSDLERLMHRFPDY